MRRPRGVPLRRDRDRGDRARRNADCPDKGVMKVEGIPRASGPVREDLIDSYLVNYFFVTRNGHTDSVRKYQLLTFAKRSEGVAICGSETPPRFFGTE